MLFGKVMPVKELSKAQMQDMFAIMQKYYENIIWDNFFTDLKSKCDVILLCDESGYLHGFTTIAVFYFDKKTQLLFSGDTIVEKDYWGNNDLSQIWVKNAFNLAKAFHGKTYWLLLTKGYKTYKFLHTFFNEFYPRAHTKTPQSIQGIIDKFAVEKYGSCYQNGVLAAGKDYLKAEFAEINETKLKNKNTAFFLEKNPDYIKGDELICITELSLQNLNKLGRKMLER